MALESVESNYVHADDGLINAGKNDSEAEEDLEDGEIADDDEVEEGAIEEEAGSAQPPADSRKSPANKRSQEFDRRSPPVAGRHEHHKAGKRKRRAEKTQQRNKKKRQHENSSDHHNRFPQGPSDRKHSRDADDEGFVRDGFASDDEGAHSRKRKRMDFAERRNNRRASPEKRDKPHQRVRHIPEHRKKPCMFYLQGKCHKGDMCTYLHTGTPDHKNELCKFYLMDCCAKKEKCLYMHSEFPCKFFHTGMKCYSKENCKFSHDPLTDRTREILLKHIETAPKEILGEFPQLPRNEVGEVILPTAIPPANMDGSIPSLLDIRIYSVDKNKAQDPQASSSSQNATADADFDAQLRQRQEDQRVDREEQQQEAPVFNFYRDLSEQGSEKKRNISPRKSIRDDSDDENGLVIMDDREDDSSHRESGGEDVVVPSNLPKRQRELFLRIQHQQQQRDAEAAANTDDEEQKKSDDEDHESGARAEETWYSSDDEEEERSLTEVLKNLDKVTDRPVDSKPNAKTAMPSSFDLSGIKLNEDLTKLLNTIKPKETVVNSMDSDMDSRNMNSFYRETMDPRARDPRSRPEPPRVQQQQPQPSFSKDVDLRVAPTQKVDTDLRQTLFGDTDLRIGPMEIAFKPPPLHLPCEEIDCSIDLNPAIEFKLKPFPVEKPDYSGLRLNPRDPAVRQDPRLQKLLSELDLNSASPMSPPGPSQNDPRQRAADPRMARAPPQPTIIPTQPQQQQQQPPMMDMAQIMMLQQQQQQQQMPMGQEGMLGPMAPHMMQQMMASSFMPNMQMQQHNNYQPQPQNQPRSRGGRSWNRGRGRGRGGGFRNNRGWGNFDRDRRDGRDSRMSPPDRTPEYSNDSD
ncbi:bromodomain-containing protein 4-like isoform X3 [Cloeon dipterum]|uniref:bromodomain-containing protein 4-like isoform X3 n=1 Tax=Cloeon dipterum TaxID=197152 RepID=UPI00321FA919